MSDYRPTRIEPNRYKISQAIWVMETQHGCYPIPDTWCYAGVAATREAAVDLLRQPSRQGDRAYNNLTGEIIY